MMLCDGEGGSEESSFHDLAQQKILYKIPHGDSEEGLLSLRKNRSSVSPAHHKGNQKKQSKVLP